MIWRGLMATVAAVVIFGGCGPSPEQAETTTSTSMAAPTVRMKLVGCLPDQNGQRVCTDGHGLTMPAPQVGAHDDAADCTWAAERSRTGRPLMVCRSDG
jgi:hypothetical protein